MSIARILINIHRFGLTSVAATSLNSFRRRVSFRETFRPMIEGQENSKRASFAGPAFDLNPATVIFMIRSQIGSPKPNPFLFLALKNGRKILGKSLSSMPKPVSVMDITIIGPEASALWCLASTFKLPPIGMASMAKIDQYLFQLLHIGVDVRQV
jgi:hypothetical protein